MTQWQMADAKQKLTQMISAAEKNGPQLVVQQKEPVAVILSRDEYNKLARQASFNFENRRSASDLDSGCDPNKILQDT
jgi:prevent-host-death family protein